MNEMSFLPRGLLETNFNEAQSSFNAAINSANCSSKTFVVFMQKAENCGRFDEVERAFALSRKLEKINVNIANIFLGCAATNGRFDLVRNTYDEIMEKGLATEFTFARYIKAAGIEENFEQAQRGYNDAKVLEREGEIKLNCEIISNFIHAAGRKGKIKQVKAAYSEAKVRGLDSAVQSTYNSTMSRLRKA